MVEPQEKQEIREILIVSGVKVTESIVQEIYDWLMIKLEDQYKFLEQ